MERVIIKSLKAKKIRNKVAGKEISYEEELWFKKGSAQVLE